MQGNDRYRQKERIEDRNISRIDRVAMPIIKAPEPMEPGLRVSLFELIAHKAATTGAAIRWGNLNINVRPA